MLVVWRMERRMYPPSSHVGELLSTMGAVLLVDSVFAQQMLCFRKYKALFISAGILCEDKACVCCPLSS